MSSVMIIIGSVRPGRISPSIAEWVRAAAVEHGFEVDLVDLAELNMPFMDEPNHPRARKYTKPHTIAWSERVDAADAVIFITPEYNHSMSPVLKNALDFLSLEWWRKPYGVASYGGVSGGTRGVTALEPVWSALGMLRTGAFPELPFAGQHITDGAYVGGEKENAILGKMLDELDELIALVAE